MTILEFANVIKKEIVIRYCPNRKPGFIAAFYGGDIKAGVGLKGEYGEANLPNEALKNFASLIQGKTIVFDAMSETKRREFVAPDKFNELEP